MVIEGERVQWRSGESRGGARVQKRQWRSEMVEGVTLEGVWAHICALHTKCLV